MQPFLQWSSSVQLWYFKVVFVYRVQDRYPIPTVTVIVAQHNLSDLSPAAKGEQGADIDEDLLWGRLLSFRESR